MLSFYKIFLLFCILISVLQFLMWVINPSNFLLNVSMHFNKSSYFSQTDIPFHKKTVILMWTKYYFFSNEKLLSLIFSGRKWDPDCCTGNDMEITLNRSLLSTASVIVFDDASLSTNDLPHRYSGQIWVLFEQESPVHSLDLAPYPNLFNWTMTYRKDSDIWAPYGYKVPLNNPLSPNSTVLMPGNIPLSAWIAQKSQLISGVISNCHTQSKRGAFINLLNKLSLTVDIYGSCGSYRICSRFKEQCNHSEFWSILGATYKFYFAAENSLCEEYISEKFWRTLELGMVPVVYGGANYTRVAPPNSFIDIRNFKTPLELVKFIKWLAANPTEYSRYFEWRRNFTVVTTDAWHGWCKLCNMARQYTNHPKSVALKTYKDLKTWWIYKGNGSSKREMCSKPPEYLNLSPVNPYFKIFYPPI